MRVKFYRWIDALRDFLCHVDPLHKVPDHWHQWVLHHMESAQLAVINWAPKPSESLLWELRTAVTKLGLPNVLIWFPQPDDWGAFCRDTPEELPRPIPPDEDVLLLGFSTDRRAVVRETRSGPLRHAVTGPTEAVTPTESGNRIVRFFKRHLRASPDFGPRS